MKYVTSGEMRRIDKMAQEKFGIPSIILMENAGLAASKTALDMLPANSRKGVLCVCGKGNNGGDGFVCARHLINKGIKTDIVLIGEAGKLKGDAKTNYDILEKMKAPITILKNDKGPEKLKAFLGKADLLVDAIFGIGLSGKVEEPFASVINLMNQSGKPILSLDTPSGLDATEGKTLGPCIKAAKTITFAFPKTGFIKNEAPSFIGELVVADISIPQDSP